MKDIVSRLIKTNKTISTMESCTGGFIASSITNISGSSKVFKFGAVTYSNEYKVMLGVKESTINKYSVYSMEVANEMSKRVSKITNSDYGIGVTGTINELDINNPTNELNKVYISIYIKEKDKFISKCINTIEGSRLSNKEYIKDEIINILRGVI